MKLTKEEEISKLKEEVSILKNYETWKNNQDFNYEEREKALKDNLYDLKIKCSLLEDIVNKPLVGSSIYQVIILLLTGGTFLFNKFYNDEPLLISYLLIGLGVLSLFCFIKRKDRGARPITSNIGCLLGSGICFILSLVLMILIKDGTSVLKGIDFLDLPNNTYYESIASIFMYVSFGLAFIVLLVSLCVKCSKNSKIKNGTKEYIQVIDDITDLEVDLSKIREEYDSIIVSKTKDYFSKYDLILPNKTSSECKGILEILKREDVPNLNKAIKLYKGENHA